jgi:probable HAF family extracellular repeat protein
VDSKHVERSVRRGVVLLAVLGCLAAHAETAYLVEDLGAADPELLTHALAVNEFGQAVGISSKNELGSTRAVAFTGAVERLPGLRWGATAYGVDRDGVVVGEMSLTHRQIPRAFRWEAGVLQDLGTLGGQGARARAINDAGHIVGGAATAAGVEHPFLWSDGTLKDLGTIDGRPDSTAEAAAISANDLVVGSGSVAGDVLKHAFLWRAGTMTDIAITELQDMHTYAAGVNRHGVVVGMLDAEFQYYSELFRWTAEGGFEHVRPLEAGARAYAQGVNDAGLVVGCSERNYGGSLAAVLMRPGELRLIDLNKLKDPVSGKGWQLECALAVNESGQIVGYGWHGGPQEHAFRLTPMR